MHSPNSHTCFDWMKTCHKSGAKTHLLARANKIHKLPKETTTRTFDLEVIRSCNQETLPNLCASRLQEKYPLRIWFYIFRDGRCKQNISWLAPRETVIVVFPRPSRFPALRVSGKQTNLFHLGPVIKYLLFTSDQSTCWSGNFMLSKILNTTLNTSLHQCCWNVCP